MTTVWQAALLAGLGVEALLASMIALVLARRLRAIRGEIDAISRRLDALSARPGDLVGSAVRTSDDDALGGRSTPPCPPFARGGGASGSPRDRSGMPHQGSSSPALGVEPPSQATPPPTPSPLTKGGHRGVNPPSTSTSPPTRSPLAKGGHRGVNPPSTRTTLGPPPGPLIVVPSLESPGSPEVATEAVAEMGRRFSTLWAMADAGEPPRAIAEATGHPIGQVELILGLRRPRAPFTAPEAVRQ